jgi:hypothetical protein
MSDVTVVTNNQPRNLIDGWELTAKERADFDYLDWASIQEGTDGATFFRYRGQLYDLGEFQRDYGITRDSGLPAHLSKWDGYQSDSFFSATVVRLSNDGETVVVGTVLS